MKKKAVVALCSLMAVLSLAACGKGKLLKIYGLVHLYVLGMNHERIDASLQIRLGHDDPSVKTTGAEQCLVQDLRPVCCGKHNDTLGGIEAVHLRQELV